jgi:hypothetical protein
VEGAVGRWHWFGAAGPALVAVLLLLALGDAFRTHDRGAWIGVAFLAAILAVMVAAGRGRPR